MRRDFLSQNNGSRLGGMSGEVKQFVRKLFLEMIQNLWSIIDFMLHKKIL